MFVFDNKTIEELSYNGGLYDYITDIEDKKKLSPNDRELIYQYSLLYIQDNLSPMRITEFLNKLNSELKIKKDYEETVD